MDPNLFFQPRRLCFCLSVGWLVGWLGGWSAEWHKNYWTDFLQAQMEDWSWPTIDTTFKYTFRVMFLKQDFVAIIFYLFYFYKWSCVLSFKKLDHLLVIFYATTPLKTLFYLLTCNIWEHRVMFLLSWVFVVCFFLSVYFVI